MQLAREPGVPLIVDDVSMEELPHIWSIDDVLSHPQLLAGKTPQKIEARLGKRPGWRVETLGWGAPKGQGWVLREYTPQGHPTGRVIRCPLGAPRSSPTPEATLERGAPRIPLK